MGFLDSLFGAVSEQAGKANERYEKGYEKASKLSDAELERRIRNTSNKFEQMGMMKAYKERHDS